MASGQAVGDNRDKEDRSQSPVHSGWNTKRGYGLIPKTAVELSTDINIGSKVEVLGMFSDLKYGVVRWLGRHGTRAIVGLEMERESAMYTNAEIPSDLKMSLEFEVPASKVYLTYLDQVKEDRRVPKVSAFLETKYQQGTGNMQGLSPKRETRNQQGMGNISPRRDIKHAQQTGTTQGVSTGRETKPLQGGGNTQAASMKKAHGASQEMKTLPAQGQRSTPSDLRQSGRTTMVPTPKTAVQLRTDIDINCMVEVKGLPDDLKYGMVRWLGEYDSLPIVGLEMKKSSDWYRNQFLTHHLFNYIPRRTNFVNLAQVMRSRQSVNKLDIPAHVTNQAMKTVPVKSDTSKGQPKPLSQAMQGQYSLISAPDVQVKKLQVELQRSKDTIKSLEASVKFRDKQLQELKRELQMSQETVQSAQAVVKSPDAQVKKLQAELQRSKDIIKSLEASLKSRDAQVQQLQRELQKSQGALQPVQGAVKSRDEQVRQLQCELRKSQEIIQSKQAVVESREEEVQRLHCELRKSKEALKAALISLPASPQPTQTSINYNIGANMNNKSPLHAQTPTATDNRTSMTENSLMAQMIKENAEFFVENLKIDPMLEASLLQSGVLTESDQELVESKGTQDDKRFALCNAIRKGGPKAPAAFLNALLKSKQPHVIQAVLHTRDKYEKNGAQQLIDAVEKYFGCEVSEDLRKNLC